MNGQRRSMLVAMLAMLAIVAGAAGANGAATWPSNVVRNMNQPRTENSTVAGNNSGATFSGANTTAISNNAGVNYLHAVSMTDGTGGAVDWNNAAGRPANYPYFGTNTPYGGNDAPMSNNALVAPYWNGDCGVMRPHNLTDDFDAYLGAYTPKTIAGTAQMTGGVATFTSTAFADFGYLEVGDRFQTSGFPVRVFNRTNIAPLEGNSIDPLTNAPYWRVTGHTAWNQITATPDVATPISFTSTSTTSPVTLTSTRGGVRQFQGAARGQMIQITGSTNASWNGFYTITTAEAAQQLNPHIIVATAIAPTAPAGAVTGPAVATRITDADDAAVKVEAARTFQLTAGTAAGVYTTAGATNGLVAGQTVTISGATPAAHNGAGKLITAVSPTTFTVSGAGSALAAPFTGVATVTDSPSVANAAGVGERGSDCNRIVYTRSTNTGALNGVNWDGGGTGVAAPCAAGVSCGSVNAFNLAGGPTNGGVKTYLSETHTTHPSIEAHGQYVYATFMTTNGGALTYWSNLCNNDNRDLYIRTNSNYGAWDAWGAPIKLNTGPGESISSPSLAVDDVTGRVYVIAVNAESGDIILWTSTNNGGSFSKGTIGNTRFINYGGWNDASSLLGEGTFGTQATAGCVNPPDGIANGPRSDSNGYGQFGGAWNQIGNFVRVAAHNGNVGAAWFTNSANDPARAITGAVTAGGVATFTTSAPHNFNNGDRVRVTGMTPVAYNGTYFIGDQFQSVAITGTATWAGNVATFNTTNTAGLVVGEQVSVSFLPDPEGFSGIYTIATVTAGTRFTAAYPCPSYCPDSAAAGTGTYRLTSLNGLPSAATTFKVPIAGAPGAGGAGTVQELNNDGDRIIAKVCSSPCTSWPTAGCPGASCVMHLAASGAGSNCENYRCRRSGPGWDQDAFPFYDRTYTDTFGGTETSPEIGSKDVSIAAGPSPTGTRIGFAWVSDSGEGPGNTVISRGLWYRGWESSTNAWSPNRLVACARGAFNDTGGVGTPGAATNITAATTTAGLVTFTVPNAFAVGNVVRTSGMSNDFFNNTWIVSAATAANFSAVNTSTQAGLVTGTTGATARLLAAAVNDPCRGKFAWNAYMSFLHPVLDFYGTSGIGVVYGACPYTGLIPKTPCKSDEEANGEEILYKESGDNGANWGSDWEVTVAPPGTQASSYTRVAIPPTSCVPSCGTFTADMWRQSFNPDLEFDVPNDSANGCTADANGSPVNGCVRYIFFNTHTMGVNPNDDLSYVTFLMRGIQT